MENEADKVARYVKRAFALAEQFVNNGKVRIAVLEDPITDLADMFETRKLGPRRLDGEFPFGPPKEEVGALDWIASYEKDAETAQKLTNAAVLCLRMGYNLPPSFRTFLALILDDQLNFPGSKGGRPTTFHRDTLLQFIALQLVSDFGLNKGASKETIKAAASPPITAASVSGAALYALGCRDLTLDQSNNLVYLADLLGPEIQKLYRLDDSFKLILADPRPKNGGRRPLVVALERLGMKYP